MSKNYTNDKGEREGWEGVYRKRPLRFGKARFGKNVADKKTRKTSFSVVLPLRHVQVFPHSDDETEGREMTNCK